MLANVQTKEANMANAQTKEANMANVNQKKPNHKVFEQHYYKQVLVKVVASNNTSYCNNIFPSFSKRRLQTVL